MSATIGAGTPYNNIFVEKQGNNSVKTVFTTTGMSKFKRQTTG
jgi:hypothetical protein